jgi:catechol 2,3-dioxygenase-like lactoylglutathione lyase family enzyme
MALEIIGVNHVNVTVPGALEQAAKDFYGTVLGLRQIPKPEGSRQNVGAWYELGPIQLHLSLEDNVHNEVSDRHVCYQVVDAASAELHVRNAGVEIIGDTRPIKGVSRFFVRDPGGNMIEITDAGSAGSLPATSGDSRA